MAFHAIVSCEEQLLVDLIQAVLIRGTSKDTELAGVSVKNQFLDYTMFLYMIESMSR